MPNKFQHELCDNVNYEVICILYEDHYRSFCLSKTRVGIIVNILLGANFNKNFICIEFQRNYIFQKDDDDHGAPATTCLYFNNDRVIIVYYRSISDGKLCQFKFRNYIISLLLIITIIYVIFVRFFLINSNIIL